MRIIPPHEENHPLIYWTYEDHTNLRKNVHSLYSFSENKPTWYLLHVITLSTAIFTHLWFSEAGHRFPTSLCLRWTFSLPKDIPLRARQWRTLHFLLCGGPQVTRVFGKQSTFLFRHSSIGHRDNSTQRLIKQLYRIGMQNKFFTCYYTTLYTYMHEPWGVCSCLHV